MTSFTAAFGIFLLFTVLIGNVRGAPASPDDDIGPVVGAGECRVADIAWWHLEASSFRALFSRENGYRVDGYFLWKFRAPVDVEFYLDCPGAPGGDGNGTAYRYQLEGLVNSYDGYVIAVAVDVGAWSTDYFLVSRGGIGGEDPAAGDCLYALFEDLWEAAAAACPFRVKRVAVPSAGPLPGRDVSGDQEEEAGGGRMVAATLATTGASVLAGFVCLWLLCACCCCCPK